MKRLTRTLLSLYPRHWRERYATEFAALVEDTGGSRKHFFDIISEGLKMRLLSTNWRFLGGFALAGLLLATALAIRLPNRYISKAVLQLEPVAGSTTADHIEAIVRLQSEVLSRTSLSRVIQSPGLDLYKEERAAKPLEDVIEHMKTRDVRVVIESNYPNRFMVSFWSEDPVLARNTVQRLVERFRQGVREDAGKPQPGIRQLDPPSLPVSPISPNRPVIGFTGLVAGLFVGIIALWLRRRISSSSVVPI